jgi:AI-2 transport protein TqsA
MNVNLSTATRIGLSLSAALGIAALLFFGRSVFIPLTLAVLLASVLYPMATFLNRRLFVPWFFACFSALLTVVALFLVTFVAFAISVPRTIEGFPKGEEEWEEQYKKIQGNLSAVIPYKIDHWLPPDPRGSYVFQKTKEVFTGPKVSDALIGLVQIAGEYLWQGILIMFITLFLLIEGQMLADKVRAIFGTSRETQQRVSLALADMAESLRTYLVWRTIVNLALGIVLGLVYNAAALKYWYLWALLVMFLSYVPYLGTIAAGIPPVLDALLFVDPLTCIAILVFYTGLVTFEGYIIVPWVMGRSMDLNATTVILACLFWQEIWGLAGLFLAMPIMAAVKAICMQVEGWQRWGELMGSGPAKPLELDADSEKLRLDEIARHAPNGDGTVVMDHGPRAEKGGSPVPGDPKSDPYR